jgi:tripartite-type tricarboxylate transporter receptor subunit TctC
LPGYEATSIQAVFAPSGTPGAVIVRLNQEIVRCLNQPEVKERLFNSGVEAVGSSPEELATTIKAEMSRLGKVIREAGIRIE